MINPWMIPIKIELDSESERLRKEQQANALREEKKMILKRRLKARMGEKKRQKKERHN